MFGTGVGYAAFAVEITILIASKILPTHHVGHRMVVLTVD